jgi:hypothetical protein
MSFSKSPVPSVRGLSVGWIANKSGLLRAATMRIAGRPGYSKSSSLLLFDTVLLMTLSTAGAPKADHPYLIDVDPESCYRRILCLLTLPLQYCRSLMLIKKKQMGTLPDLRGYRTPSGLQIEHGWQIKMTPTFTLMEYRR